MFLDMEEKKMKYEAEQQEEERDFQLRMMSMLFGGQGVSNPPQGYVPPYQPFHDY